MSSITIKKHPNGLDFIDIDTDLCTAQIFLQGAQIVQYQPKGQKPLLWVSSADDFKPGNGIRGGIPICWPWFGMSNTDGFPQHGFARTQVWTVESTKIIDECVEIVMALTITPEVTHYWPHNTTVKALFSIGKSLSVSIVNTNNGDSTVELTQALHTYFPIDDIHQLSAGGFAGSKYIEFGEGPFNQDEDIIQFDRETDRVYTDLSLAQQLRTPSGVIEISRENSQSAVLWNPWIDKSQRLSRFNDDDYLTMVCLEAANVLEDKVQLQPGQSHKLTTTIKWQG